MIHFGSKNTIIGSGRPGRFSKLYHLFWLTFFKKYNGARTVKVRKIYRDTVVILFFGDVSREHYQFRKHKKEREKLGRKITRHKTQ
jgi:hypothetical protein